MMGHYSEELALHFKEIKTYVQCNVLGQKLHPRCEISKHIFVFTYQLYIFILVENNDVHQRLHISEIFLSGT
jgi:hypothetical protein